MRGKDSDIREFGVILFNLQYSLCVPSADFSFVRCLFGSHRRRLNLDLVHTDFRLSLQMLHWGRLCVLASIFITQAPVASQDASKRSVIFPRLSAEQRATQIFPLPLCDSVFCAGAY
jgi:hypothetical protein